MQRAILDANMVRIVEGSCRKYPFPQSLTGLANTTDFFVYSLWKLHYRIFAKHVSTRPVTDYKHRKTSHLPTSHYDRSHINSSNHLNYCGLYYYGFEKTPMP